MNTQIFHDYNAFNARVDKTLNGVTQQFADAYLGWDKEANNDACWNCSDCSSCYDCSDCSSCSGLENARPVQSNAIDSPLMNIPVIENIHQKVLSAVIVERAFDMANWHCATTHCRGGTVIALAGEPGRKLEDLTSSEFAAMMIYKASSPIPVSPVRFYESNEKAMADIRRCAEEENNNATAPAA